MSGFRRFVPKAPTPFLLIVLLLLVLASAIVAILWLRDFLNHQNVFALLGVAFWAALAVGLWLLHPIARWVAVIILWLVIIFLPIGVFNPFAASDWLSEYGEIPHPFDLAILVVPEIMFSLIALHALGKYKANFRR